MEIIYLGLSAFRLRGKDVTVVTDPYSPASGLSMGKVTANIVTVSHHSPNHSNVSAVGHDPRVVSGPGEYEVAGVLIGGIATAEEPGKGPRNTAYVMRLEDISICHLGDIAGKLNNQQIEALGNVDVLLVPVGGGNALKPTEAAEVISQIEPAVVIPMHYALEGSKLNGLEPVDSFMREMGSKEFTREPKLSITRSALGSEVRIAVLEQRHV